MKEKEEGYMEGYVEDEERSEILKEMWEGIIVWIENKSKVKS